MTDDYMYGLGVGIAHCVLRGDKDLHLPDVLDPERPIYHGHEDSICIAQQIIAEATGLVGLPEIPDGGLPPDDN